MKKLCIVILLIMSLTACGSEKTINGITFDTQGIFTIDKMNPKIEYKLIIGNFVWGLILFETIVAPIYFFGFSLFEPIGLREWVPTCRGSI